MDMRKLLEAVTKFAGEPEQKPGDQVKGTDVAKKGTKEHPFKGQLVGDSKDNMLKGLSQVSEDKSLEWKLAEAWANFNEDDIGVEPKRAARKGSRPVREYTKNGKPSKRYTTVEEGWNTGNDRVTLPDEPSTYWAGKGALQDDYNRLYDELVPSQGKADTIEGEVLRASSKIVYRHYNDGDLFNEASFDQLEPYIGKVTSYDDLAHKAIEFALKANGNYTPNPDWDSLDVMDYGPVEDDYEDEEDDDYDDWSDNVDNEDEEELDEVKHFQTAYGWAGGRNEKTGGTHKHPDQIKADREAKKAAKAQQSKDAFDDMFGGGNPAKGLSIREDGVDEITSWGIPQEEWADFETQFETAKQVFANMDDEDIPEAFQLFERQLDSSVVDALDYGLFGGDYERFLTKLVRALSSAQQSEGTEPRAAIDLATMLLSRVVSQFGNELQEGWKSALATGAMGAALAFGGSGAAQAGQSPEQAPQKASAPATQQAQAQNPYHNDLGVLVGVAQSKGGMQVLGKILSADQIQQVKAAYAKAKADPNLAKSAQFKQGQQLGFELGNSYADSSSQQMTDLNKRGPSYAGILSPMVVKPGEARSAEDITKVNQANAGKLKQAVTAAYGNMMSGGLQEGWESGPEERSYRSRGGDPDDAYDAMRQEKADAEAQAAQAKRPQKKYYTLSGRGPNQEPNYEFPGEYDSQDAADAARARLMADPKTPNPRDIGIRSRTRYLDLKESIESADPIEGAVLSAVQELIQQGHTEVAPEVITNMVVAATSQPFLLKDLVDANKNSSAIQHYVDSINPTKVKFSSDILTVKNENPAKKSKEQAQTGVANMAARAAGRNRLGEASTPLRDREDYDAKNKALQDIQMDPSTSQDPQLSAELARRKAELVQQAKQLGISESRAHKLIANKLKQVELQRQMGSPESEAAYTQHVDRMKKSQQEYLKKTPNTIYKREIDEYGAAGGASAAPNAGAAPVNDPQQAQKTAQATSALKAATGSTAPTTNIAKALDAASQGTAVSTTDMKAIEPLMKDIATVSQDPKLANQFKTLANQANQAQKLQQK